MSVLFTLMLARMLVMGNVRGRRDYALLSAHLTHIPHQCNTKFQCLFQVVDISTMKRQLLETFQSKKIALLVCSVSGGIRQHQQKENKEYH